MTSINDNDRNKNTDEHDVEHDARNSTLHIEHGEHIEEASHDGHDEHSEHDEPIANRQDYNTDDVDDEHSVDSDSDVEYESLSLDFGDDDDHLDDEHGDDSVEESNLFENFYEDADADDDVVASTNYNQYLVETGISQKKCNHDCQSCKMSDEEQKELSDRYNNFNEMMNEYRLQRDLHLTHHNAIPNTNNVVKVSVNFDKDLQPLINTDELFIYRWGYRNKGISEEDYRSLLNKTVVNEYNKLCRWATNNIKPYFVYSYFQCSSTQNFVHIFDNDNKFINNLTFQNDKAGHNLAHFFTPHKEVEAGSDKSVIGLAVPTLGVVPDEVLKNDAEDDLKTYYIKHEFFSVVLNALERYVSEYMRREVVKYIGDEKHPGVEVVLGMPECPSLDNSSIIYGLLGLKNHGMQISLNKYTPYYTSSMLFIPNEQASSVRLGNSGAIVASPTSANAS